jgi:hypothetical protein
VDDLVTGRAAKDSDLIFFLVEKPADLGRIATLVRSLKPDGAIWTVRRKGKDAPVAEQAVRDAAKAAGLVDVKVVGFSATHTAEKYVIPKRLRGAAGR